MANTQIISNIKDAVMDVNKSVVQLSIETRNILKLYNSYLTETSKVHTHIGEEFNKISANVNLLPRSSKDVENLKKSLANLQIMINEWKEIEEKNKTENEMDFKLTAGIREKLDMKVLEILAILKITPEEQEAHRQSILNFYYKPKS